MKKVYLNIYDYSRVESEEELKKEDGFYPSDSDEVKDFFNVPLGYRNVIKLGELPTQVEISPINPDGTVNNEYNVSHEMLTLDVDGETYDYYKKTPDVETGLYKKDSTKINKKKKSNDYEEWARERDVKLEAIEISFKGATFQGDAVSRGRMLTQVSYMERNKKTETVWKDKKNSDVALTLAELLSLSDKCWEAEQAIILDENRPPKIVL